MAFAKNMINIVSLITKKPCWGVVTGEGSGSIISLQLGEKIPRDTIHPNDLLSDDCRNFDPSHCVFVFLSSWELTFKGRVICSSASDNSNEGEMVVGLSRLVGLEISNAEIIEKQGLYIDFNRFYTMSIFFDAKERYGEGSDNVTIFTPDFTYTVNADMELEVDIRQNDKN